MLTQRTAHLRDHPGQISFPGGRCGRQILAATYRLAPETFEEIGLTREHVELVGYLPEYRTATGFASRRVVAMVTPPFDLRLDAPSRWQKAFRSAFVVPDGSANHQRHSLHYRGKLRHYYAMPYGDYFIWGATAGIIMSLYRALQASAG
ncbi:CoA pyrophosphatase [Accumulibacter sp.]|uniref:NUDIX hydrolase n=1 Tax=Accumulibacter sp. TaxID=2053492 RepID=UPI0025CCB98D|nr:CoA pyrophosphatase [Accumulibacter sp.]